MRYTPKLILAEAKADIIIAFARKWTAYEGTGKLFRELIATVIYADTLGLDPAQAICDNAVLKKAMANDASLAELAGADLPIALESARVLSKAFGAPAHPGLGRSCPQAPEQKFLAPIQVRSVRGERNKSVWAKETITSSWQPR